MICCRAQSDKTLKCEAIGLLLAELLLHATVNSGEKIDKKAFGWLFFYGDYDDDDDANVLVLAPFPEACCPWSQKRKKRVPVEENQVGILILEGMST